MDHEARVASVEREAAALVDALRAAPRTAPVPTCPDWTVADLAAHVGTFSALWTHVLCEASGAEKPPYDLLTDDDDPADWYEPLAGHLVDALGATTGDAPCWTWVADEQHAGFVARRVSNELAVHRLDAQSASNATTPLDAEVAVEVIEEIFVMLPAWENPPDGSGLTLHLHGLEGGEWTITLAPEGPQLDHDQRAADLTLNGSASDLALLLYRRPTIGPVERTGDPAALEAWYREFLFD